MEILVHIQNDTKNYTCIFKYLFDLSFWRVKSFHNYIHNFWKNQILSYVFFLIQTWVIFPCVIHRHRVLLKGDHYDLLTRGSHYQKVFIGCKHKSMSGEGRETLLHFFYVDWWSNGFCFCLNKKIYIFNVVDPKQENNVEAIYFGDTCTSINQNFNSSCMLYMYKSTCILKV